MLRIVALLLVIVVMLTALGCTAAGQETTTKEETAAGNETTADQETTTGGAVTPLATQDTSADDLDKHILRCQLDEASKDNGGGTKHGQFVDEVFQEARERSVVPEQVLSEHGYDCGWSALQKGGGKV
jgi:uncharacterized protein YceK